MKFDKFWVLILLVALMGAYGCSDDDDTTQGDWDLLTPFKGSRRASVTSFVIDNNAYVGLGYDGDDYVNDFYMFNETNGYWVQVDDFPGIGREKTVSFTIGEKAYVIGGYNRDLTTEEMGDVWEFDPSNDSSQWTQLSDFPGSARYNAVGFSTNGKGYFGTGNDGDNYLNDFWAYTPDGDSWEEIISLRGQKREEAFTFTVGDQIFVGGGRNNGLYQTDLWQFDQDEIDWIDRSIDDDDDEYDDFYDGVARVNCAAFVVNDKAYLAMGYNSGILSSVYEYDPSSDNWESRTSFEGTARQYCTSFVLNNEAYVLTGQSGTDYFDDMWGFDPEVDYDDGYYNW